MYIQNVVRLLLVVHNTRVFTMDKNHYTQMLVNYENDQTHCYAGLKKHK